MDTKDSEAEQDLSSDLRASREEAGRKHRVEVSSSQTQGKWHRPRSSREGTRGGEPCVSTLGVHQRESSSVGCRSRQGRGDGRGDEKGEDLWRTVQVFPSDASPARSAGFPVQGCPHSPTLTLQTQG